MSNGTIKIECPERVAYDLALKIFNVADGEPSSQDKNREYWLKLYSQCLSVVQGQSPEDILRKP